MTETQTTERDMETLRDTDEVRGQRHRQTDGQTDGDRETDRDTEKRGDMEDLRVSGRK